MRYLMAHDIGTSGDKATLFREDGTLIKSILGEYPTTYGKGGVVEQHPNDWWAAVCRTTQELMTYVENKKDVAAVSFGGQMMGCACIDKNGEPLRSSIIWADTRSQKQADIIKERYGWDEFFETTGHRLSPSHTITKLMWIKENQPDIYAKTYKTLNSKDFIVLKLTGRFVTDFSDASGTLAYNINTREWATDVMESVDIDPEKFPEIRSGLEVVGTVTAEASKACGLPEGTPVVLGGGDGQMCAIGSGTVGAGDITCNLGTSAFVSYYYPERVKDPLQRIVSWNATQPDMTTTCGTMQAFGASIAWMRDNLCQMELAQSRAEGVSRYKYINENSLKSPRGANGLLFLPYLQGERSPYWNGAAKGSFVGLNMHHNHNDLLRAVFEGVAMNMGIIYNIFRENLGDKMPKEVIVTGGGINSPIVAQTLADIFEATIKTIDISDEVGSFGGAIAAGYAIGIYDDILQAKKFMKITKEVEPDPEGTAFFKEKMALLDRVYRGIEPMYPEMI